tara:strand:- start:1417 stop:2163 length:747 start_codon:yes stop_codon:yes gene_type:complete
MHNLKAVFWDVDGTIADTELCGHRVAFNLAFKDYDLDWHWNENKYIELLKISGGLNRIIKYRNEIKSELLDEECSKIQLRKRFHYNVIVKAGKINVRTGVVRLIEELSNSGVEQFIVTTSGRGSLEPFLNTSLLSQLNLFSGIITYEDVCNHKPFPDAYQLAIKLSKKSNKNCIAIEDSMIGVEAARAANLNVLMTLPPWSSSVQNITKKANACVDNLGNGIIQPKVFYGKTLICNYVDYAYLNSIIN